MKQTCIVLCGVLLTLQTCYAADSIWTGAVDNDFLNAANWDGGLPTSDEDVIVINGGANQPVVIPESAEMMTIGGIQLGTSGETGGQVIQNGGTIILAPFNLDGFETDYQFKSYFGQEGTLGSSWIMNNDATILYDGPMAAEGFGFDANGENEFDLELGAKTGEAVGRLELHDNAVFRLSDDLKIGAEDNGNGHVIVDGNAVLTAGSGISVGEKENGRGVLDVGGNGLVVTGNSAGPGQKDLGFTDEGYLTLSVQPTGTAIVNLTDSAKLYARTLQQRDGLTTMTIGDNAEFHVFDVFNFEEPDLGNATVFGPATSQVASAETADATFIVKDNGVMTVDSEREGSSWSGLALSGGTNSGGNSEGGKSLLEVRDQGSFTVQQDLNMTLGTGELASSTLKVVGPDATVAINGDLQLALDTEGIENLGSATIQSVITGNAHSTIVVGGDAYIGNGSLAVELDGYAPRGGESYTLLQADSVIGDSFFEVDFSMAELAEGLDWVLTLDGNAVTLSIDGMLAGILGDFDSMNGLDVADLDLLVSAINSGGGDLAFDVNGDSALASADVTAWLELKSTADGKTFLPGDANLDGEVAFADFLALSAAFGNASTTWSEGNFDGVGGTAFPDFLVLSENFGKSGAVAASVPEPNAAFMLYVVAIAGLCVRRSRRH